MSGADVWGKIAGIECPGVEICQESSGNFPVTHPSPHRGMCNCPFKLLSVLHLLGFGLGSAPLSPHGGFISPQGKEELWTQNPRAEQNPEVTRGARVGGGSQSQHSGEIQVQAGAKYSDFGQWIQERGFPCRGTWRGLTLAQLKGFTEMSLQGGTFGSSAWELTQLGIFGVSY